MVESGKPSSQEARLHPLFVRALAGDQPAYEEVLRSVAILSRGYVRRKLGANADADDIVQEILISVHKALRTYDPARPCMPWLAAIMHYRLSDGLRRYYSAARIKKAPLEEIEAFISSSVTGQPFANESFHNESLDEALGALTQGQQAVIHAMYREDLSVSETSAKLGISISAVKVTAHRAYRKLRQRLEDA